MVCRLLQEHENFMILPALCDTIRKKYILGKHQEGNFS
ncbi:hypothetical protein MXB_642 [Myxobolus squamalis]|nr:hypothetical protein MXB_642 [Myxobolus squamalis]